MRPDVMGRLVLRPYTIHELDQMRDALRVLCQPGPGYRYRSGDRVTVRVEGGSMVGGVSGPVPTMADIEDQLRTHMINGTDPADLIAAAVVRAVDDGVAIHQQAVDRWRNSFTDNNPRQQWSTGERLMKLRRAVVELERYKTLNGR